MFLETCNGWLMIYANCSLDYGFWRLYYCSFKLFLSCTVMRLFNSASYMTLTSTNTLVGPNRAKECPRQAIQKDVPNEWRKFVFCPDFGMLIPFILSRFNLSAIMYSQLISLWSSFPQVKLHITENALKLIARKAISKNTGARGLRAILENILMDSMYEVCYVVLFWFLLLTMKTIECRCCRSHC